MDIESLSISLTANSLLRRDNAPLDTLTGIRIKSARTDTSKKTFNLTKKQKREMIGDRIGLSIELEASKNLNINVKITAKKLKCIFLR